MKNSTGAPRLLVAATLVSLASVAACTDSAIVASTAGVDSVDPPPPPPAMSEAALSSPEQTAFNFFVNKGLTKAQAAGIVGNLIQESNVESYAIQYGGGPGRGIAQWSVGGRWDSSYHDNVVYYVGQHGGSRWSLGTQLDFIWFELTNWGYGYNALRGAGDVATATIVFEDDFEICGQCEQSQRIAYAEGVLANNGGGAGGGGGGGGTGCYSDTKGREMADNACVQSKYDDLWYQCDNGSWVDRWTDPTACNGVYPL